MLGCSMNVMVHEASSNSKCTIANGLGLPEIKGIPQLVAWSFLRLRTCYNWWPEYASAPECVSMGILSENWLQVDKDHVCTTASGRGPPEIEALPVVARDFQCYKRNSQKLPETESLSNQGSGDYGPGAS